MHENVEEMKMSMLLEVVHFVVAVVSGVGGIILQVQLLPIVMILSVAVLARIRDYCWMTDLTNFFVNSESKMTLVDPPLFFSAFSHLSPKILLNLATLVLGVNIIVAFVRICDFYGIEVVPRDLEPIVVQALFVWVSSEILLLLV